MQSQNRFDPLCSDSSDEESDDESVCSMGETSSDEDDITSLDEYLRILARETGDKRYLWLIPSPQDHLDPLAAAAGGRRRIPVVGQYLGRYDSTGALANAAFMKVCEDGDVDDFIDTCDHILKYYSKVDVMDTVLFMNKQFGRDVANLIGSFLFYNHPHNKEFFEERNWHGTRLKSEFCKYIKSQFKNFNNITRNGPYWVWENDEENMKKLFFRKMNCCDYIFLGLPGDQIDPCSHCRAIKYKIKESMDLIELIESKKLLVQRSKAYLRYSVEYGPDEHLYRVQTNEFHECEMESWVKCGLLTHYKYCTYCEKNPYSGSQHKKWHYYVIDSKKLEQIYTEVLLLNPNDPRFDLDQDHSDDFY